MAGRDRAVSGPAADDSPSEQKGRRMKLRLSLLALVPAMLAAQQPADTAHLPPVVVTATRIPTPAGEVPEAVTVLSGAALRAQGIHTVFEALRDVPGATVVQTGSFGGQTSLFLRGGQSDYVKVLVDGVPVNQPGGAFDFANLTTDNVERIEVLRGPASVLYGSDAVTGVVQIFTRRGSDNARANATVRGGTYGTLIWDAEASGGGQQASYSFAVSRHTSNGLYAFNNQYRNSVFSGLVRIAPDDRTDATLTVRYADNTYHFPTNGAGQAVDPYQFNYGSGPTNASGRTLHIARGRPTGCPVVLGCARPPETAFGSRRSPKTTRPATRSGILT